MRRPWKVVTRPITALRTAVFIVSLTAASLLPMFSSPDIARADSVVLSGSSWLNGGGVDVMTGGDGSHNCVAVSGAPGQSQCSNQAGKVYSGDKWQCVEMVNRLYLAKGWTNSTWWGNGNTIVNDVPNHPGLIKQNNGAVSYMNAGDVITLDDGGLGHAGVFDHTSLSGSTTEYNFINQNADLNSSAYVSAGSLSGGNASLHMNGWAGYQVQAIVHHSGNSTPAAISRTSDSMDLFYNDNGAGKLYNYSWTSTNGWSNQSWSDPDGIIGAPAVIARTSDTLDVFYTTGSHKLIHKGWWAQNAGDANKGWDWFDVLESSGVAGDPTATSRDSNNIQVFYRDTSGNLDSTYWYYGTWYYTNGPQQLYTGAANTDPYAVTRGSGSMEVFFGKNNGNLVHLGWTSSGGWGTQDWGAGAGVTGKPTAITRNSGGDMSAYYQENGNGKVAEEAWDWQSGWAWQDWTASLAGSPSAVAGVYNLIDDFYRETGGNVVDRFFSGSWQTTNIAGSGSATSDPFAITRGNTEEVFYWNGTKLMDNNWNTTNHTWNGGSQIN